MSHGKERSEKICLNCNAVVSGRYCHVCGQENIEVKERFRDVSKHLLYDITHFDSKFFDTIRYLLFRPGFLSYEYLRGRRQRYLHPIKMYVFVSAFYFLFLFFIYKNDDALVHVNENASTQQNISQKDSLDLAKADDGLIRLTFGNDNQIKQANPDSTQKKKSARPKTIAEYRRKQDSLPAAKKDNVVQRFLKERYIKALLRAGGETQLFKNAGKELFRDLPKIMFVFLPMFALFLYALYWRRKKYYVEHLILVVHTTCALFILSFVSNLMHMGIKWPVIGPVLDVTDNLVMIYLFFYVWAAMHNFYQQSWMRTFFKYLLFLFIAAIASGIILIFSLLFLTLLHT